jgi:hypothetical protein
VNEKWVPDTKWIAVEHQGLEERQVRQVSFSLPLEKRIEVITVQVTPESPVVALEVRRFFDAFCESHPDDSLCQ